MEKWMRGLSKSTALLIGALGLVLIVFSFLFLDGILGGAILGVSVAITVMMFFKGITGMTPQERKESKG